MNWHAKRKLIPSKLDGRVIPWALCGLVAAAVAVPGAPKHVELTENGRIAQLEQRIRTLESGRIDTDYSILPSPAEELPALDSPAFYAKCNQWRVDPDRLKVLARKLAEKQGIELQGDAPKPKPAVVAAARPIKSPFVIWRSPKLALNDRPLTLTFGEPDFAKLLNHKPLKWSLSAPPKTSAPPHKHHRHHRHSS